jgi:hypothetical protein
VSSDVGTRTDAAKPTVTTMVATVRSRILEWVSNVVVTLNGMVPATSSGRKVETES